MTGRTDAPIYLLSYDRSKKENLWYVIEEKEKMYTYEQKEYVLGNEERICNMKLTDEGWIKTIHESETDMIRPLRLPAFSPPLRNQGHLAVSNSHVYIRGVMAADNDNLIFYDYSSLSNSTWEECPYSKQVSEEFTLLNNGSIHARVVDPYQRPTSSPGLLLEPKPHLSCSDWREFPLVNLDEKNNTVFKFGKLLAITDTKIYWIADGVYKCPYMISFDLEKWNWKIFDKKSFRGCWRQGVVFYDIYLFLCGNPDYDHNKKESLFVYDLKRRQWLPYPVPFFDKFVEFLPDCSGQYNKCPKFLKVCDNKFAVVWKSQKQPYEFAGTKVCWTKFIIHKDFSSSDNPFRYQFRVELYSHGVCDIMGSMLNTAAKQTLNSPRYSAILKLNGTNHKSWVESLMRNLAHMEIDVALKEDRPPKPTYKSTVAENNYYRDWKYSNRCCMKIISYHMEDSIRASIPKTRSAKVFLKSINKKYRNFSKNEKNELLSSLHSIIYDGKSGVGEHIDKVLSCYRKMKEIGLKFDDDYIVWIIMHKLPSQFDSIRSRYNAHKEQWHFEEMTTFLVKEEVDMNMAMARKRWLG